MKTVKNQRSSIFSTLAVFVLSTACTTVGDNRDGSDLKIVSEPEFEAENGKKTPKIMLASLLDVAKSEQIKRETLDVRKILEAQIATSDNDKDNAVRLWFEAMELARGRFAKQAFYGWLKAYTENLGKKIDRSILARLILAETRFGTVSEYLRNKISSSESKLIEILEQEVPEFLTADSKQEIEEGDNAPPDTGGIPAKDPLLIATANKNCTSPKLNISKWQAWQTTLPEEIRIYWQGLVQQCADQGTKALETLKGIYPRLAKNKSTQSLAVEAVSRVATLERALDQKTSAAETYRSLMELYTLPGVSPETMGLTSYLYFVRRIEDSLWAARYRATVGDYENAKKYAQAGLDLINAASTTIEAQSTARREQLATLRAESYHTLAYRIAVERQEYESASALTTLALQSQNLNREWVDRLEWFAGLYEFLAGNTLEAQKRWDQLSYRTEDESIRTMARFWQALVLKKVGNHAASSEAIDKLVESNPLSYYSVVAAQQSGIRSTQGWHDHFGDPAKLANKLYSRRSYNLTGLQKNKHLQVLQLRVEIFIKAQLYEFAKLALAELESAMSATLDIVRDAEAFLYLSRLQYNAGQFLNCIALTTKLSRANKNFWKNHPEQIFLYFPRPYLETYIQSALDTSLDKELLLSISRQESGFSPAARSGADAIGVMQLIRPTAKRYAIGLMLADEPIDKLLINPRVNIRIGSKFLQHLNTTFKGFGPAIYGGYNAGEYAMKTWLERRAFSDPLMFVELVPYGETKDYIKNVWRNLFVYRFLERGSSTAFSSGFSRAQRHVERRVGGRWTL